MSEPNPIYQKIRESAGLRLAVLFGSFFILLLLSSIISTLINNGSAGDTRSHLLWGAIAQNLLAFCIPAYLLARFSSNDWQSWLKLNKIPSIKAFFGVIVIYLVSLPAMEWLVAFNQNLHLPENLSAVEELLRKWENNSEQITSVLLSSHGFLSIIAGVLVIGLLTGFSEELFFRGGLQGIFSRTQIGVSTSIWLAAFVFSFMHFQFFGFIPRLLMGVFFGYLLAWSRSIWLPVFAHVLNNSIVVVAASITGETNKGILDNVEILSSGVEIPVIISSMVLTGIFIYIFKETIFQSNKTTDTSWQKRRLPPVSGR